MELEDFLGQVPEQGQRRARVRREEPEEGSFEEVLREAEFMERSERAKAAYLRNAPVVQNVGAAPKVDTRPRCHFCGDHRRLTAPLVLKPGDNAGSDPVRLCSFCLKCVEEDRAKRCLVCGEPSALRLLSGLCVKCRADGGKALVNLVALIKRRWVGVVKSGD